GTHAAVGSFADAEAAHNVIDHDCSRVDPASQSCTPGAIAGPHTGGQPKFGIIGQTHRFFFAVERHDGQYRTKRFFAHDTHPVIDVGENCGSVEVWPEFRQARAAREDACSPGAGIFNVGIDDARLALVNQRSDVSLRIHAVADAQPL